MKMMDDWNVVVIEDGDRERICESSA